MKTELMLGAGPSRKRSKKSMCFGVDFGNLTQKIYFFDPNFITFFRIFGGVNKLRVVRSIQYDDGAYLAVLSSEKN